MIHFIEVIIETYQLNLKICIQREQYRTKNLDTNVVAAKYFILRIPLKIHNKTRCHIKHLTINGLNKT